MKSRNGHKHMSSPKLPPPSLPPIPEEAPPQPQMTEQKLAELADLAARNPKYRSAYERAVMQMAASGQSFAAPSSPRVSTAYADVLCAGLGAAITDSIFNPLEIIKVRMQTAQQLHEPAEDFFGAASALYRRGGPVLLWTPGLTATWARGFGFTGLRVGLYPTVKRLFSGEDKEPSLTAKIAAGATTGAIGSSIANPVDMIRTRMQAQAGRTLLYPSSLSVVRAVHANEGGIAALWRGVAATAVRATLLSGAQLATYDELKSRLKSAGVATEGPRLHVFCGAVSGLVAQTVCQPADTIKSRVLSGGFPSAGACLKHTLTTEGVAGLFRGYLPAICRQTPVVLVQMPLIEQIRVAVGLSNM